MMALNGFLGKVEPERDLAEAPITGIKVGDRVIVEGNGFSTMGETAGVSRIYLKDEAVYVLVEGLGMDKCQRTANDYKGSTKDYIHLFHKAVFPESHFMLYSDGFSYGGADDHANMVLFFRHEPRWFLARYPDWKAGKGCLWTYDLDLKAAKQDAIERDATIKYIGALYDMGYREHHGISLERDLIRNRQGKTQQPVHPAVLGARDTRKKMDEAIEKTGKLPEPEEDEEEGGDEDFEEEEYGDEEKAGRAPGQKALSPEEQEAFHKQYEESFRKDKEILDPIRHSFYLLDELIEEETEGCALRNPDTEKSRPYFPHYDHGDFTLSNVKKVAACYDKYPAARKHMELSVRLHDLFDKVYMDVYYGPNHGDVSGHEDMHHVKYWFKMWHLQPISIDEALAVGKDLLKYEPQVKEWRDKAHAEQERRFQEEEKKREAAGAGPTFGKAWDEFTPEEWKKRLAYEDKLDMVPLPKDVPNSYILELDWPPYENLEAVPQPGGREALLGPTSDPDLVVRLRMTPPGQRTVRDLITPGSIIKTSYQSDPEEVKDVTMDHSYGLPIWTIHLKDGGFINDLVAQDDKVFEFFAVNPNEEVFLVKKGQDKPAQMQSKFEEPAEVQFKEPIVPLPGPEFPAMVEQKVKEQEEALIEGLVKATPPPGLKLEDLHAKLKPMGMDMPDDKLKEILDSLRSQGRIGVKGIVEYSLKSPVPHPRNQGPEEPKAEVGSALFKGTSLDGFVAAARTPPLVPLEEKPSIVSYVKWSERLDTEMKKRGWTPAKKDEHGAGYTKGEQKAQVTQNYKFTGKVVNGKRETLYLPEWNFTYIRVPWKPNVRPGTGSKVDSTSGGYRKTADEAVNDLLEELD